MLAFIMESAFVSVCDLKSFFLKIIFVQLIDQHKDVLDKAKSDYEEMKRTVDELRAYEVSDQ